MAHTALRRVSSRESLERAWGTLLSRSTVRSRKSSGIDDETLTDFNRDPPAGCRRLSEQVRATGAYRFSSLRPHLIPKSGNKYRVICVPTVRDRIVQRAVSEFLATDDRCGLANDVSFGFIPNRSVKKAAQRARCLRCNQPWAYKTDIASFFDSIPRDVLRDKIRLHVRDRSLHPLLIAASECEIQPSNPSQAKNIKKAGIKAGFGVRQGMPLSPFFANLVLKRFDKEIQSAGISMVRYADDLICFADSAAKCMAIHAAVSEALDREGLHVPPPGTGSKTQTYAPADAAEFLGLELRQQNGDYLLEIPSSQTQRIRQRIIDFATIETLTKAGIDLSGFFRRLDGLIGGYSGAYAYAHNAKHFEVVLEDARREAIERLFVSGLGIDINKLPEQQQRFLGLE